MKLRRSTFVLLSVLLVASFVLAACQPAATSAPEPTPPPAAEVPPTPVPEPTDVPEEPTEEPILIGSEAHPIKVLFVPSAEAQVIVSGGQVMADALHAATGLYFEVMVPTSYAATIEEMCASPEDTMGFIPGLGYVLASQLCGVDVAFKAIRNNLDVYYAQILVGRDSGIETLEDLEGKTWGYGDASSTSGYMVPLVMLQEAGITVGDTVETGGHGQSVSAVYNGEVDFATTFFSPPLKPEGEPVWKEGDDPEIPADLIEQCTLTADGNNIDCGGWIVLDARRNIRTEAPDVVQKVKILAISPPIPNDTLSFGAEFPAELRARIEAALLAFAETPEWADSIGNRDFYGWTGLSPARDAEYDFLRKMVEATGYQIEGLGN